jgi:hypothetical protein
VDSCISLTTKDRNTAGNFEPVIREPSKRIKYKKRPQKYQCRPPHKASKKNKKTAAINTKPTHKAIIYAASAFGLFICIADATAFLFFLFSLK